MFGFSKNTDHETVEPTYDANAMQYHPITDTFRKYGFHEHILTQKERDELEAKRKTMVLVKWGGTEAVMTYGDYVRLEQDLLADSIKHQSLVPALLIQEATEEEISLHNEWLAQQKEK